VCQEKYLPNFQRLEQFAWRIIKKRPTPSGTLVGGRFFLAKITQQGKKHTSS
jgi:hypothetical protein